MKYLKKFENFDLGRFSTEEEEISKMDDIDEIDSDDVDDLLLDNEEEEEEEEEVRWGDEIVEKKGNGLTAKQKKLPPALQKAILKKQGK